MKSKLALTLIFVHLAVLDVWSQPPSLSTPGVEARANAMLKQLSLEEKIDLIGGVNDFYIREVKHIGLPALKMADGPFGTAGPSHITTLRIMIGPWTRENSASPSEVRPSRLS